MSSLPLTKKLNEDSLFNQLNLPLSSKWTDIKKAYDVQSKELKSEAASTADSSQKKQAEHKLRRLESAYQAFSQRLSEENAQMHQTKEALKSVGLSQTSDWDRVTKRFEEIRQNQPERAQAYQPQLDVLNKNKHLLESNPKLGKRTLLTTALVLGTAGVSLAAYHHLSQQEKEEVLQTVEQGGLPGESLAGEPVAPVLDPEALEQYITENTGFEDEILSLLGLVPSPELSLTLQYKMQIFSSLVKSI